MTSLLIDMCVANPLLSVDRVYGNTGTCYKA